MASRDFYSDGVEREKWPDEMRDECARTALALTALFDGEANEADAFLAETHLANCANCAWLWHSWTRSRFLLRRMPVPEVPPGLLMRVLMAVRLMSFSKNAASRRVASTAMDFEPQLGKARDARVLTENLWMAGANPFAPRRPGTAQSATARELAPLDTALPQPPADLYTRILSQTVQSEPRQAESAMQSLAPVLEVAAPLDLEVASFTTRKPLWLTSKTFGSALLPTAAAWLFMLVSAPQLAETFQAPLPPVVAPSVSMSVHNQMRVPRKPSVRRSVAKVNNEADEATPRLAAFTERDTEPNTNYDSPTRESADTERNVLTMNADERDTPPVQPAMVSTTEPAGAPAASVATQPQPPVLKTVRRAPAISVVPVTFGSRHAEWSAPEVPTPDERAAQWHAAPRHAMSPVDASASQPRDDDAAPDAAEIITHGAHLTDSRPDDVADIVDDFRASLTAAAPDDAPTTPDGENG